jgi:RimJ/RimL family protein N-acetyltransferase
LQTTEGNAVHNPYLIGTNVYLRPLERDDAPTLKPWVNDPEVTRTLRMYRPMTLRAEEEFIDNACRGEDRMVLGIALRATDRLIGCTGLHEIDLRSRRSGFGIFLGDKGEWGKGYGTEATRLIVGHAFTTLNLHRVWLHVFAPNERGLRTYEKVGFRREGLLRQDYFREGRYWDTIVMGILQSEWEDQARG